MRLHKILMKHFKIAWTPEEKEQREKDLGRQTLQDTLDEIPDRLLYYVYGRIQSLGLEGGPENIEVFNRLIATVDREIERRIQRDAMEEMREEHNRSFGYMWIATCISVGLALFQVLLQLYQSMWG